ncbi:MAG TPA: hypothetical protein VM327_08900 [Candidatus Thermoplasmatota archaeon]|nr:hypothetical protein [Candidatus Thermoplasmatota archaeon]
MTATMFIAEEEEHSGFVVFTFNWASQARAAVPLSIEVEAPGVEWTEAEDATFVLGNGTTETDVRVYRQFTAATDEVGMRFNVTAHQGTSGQESWVGDLSFDGAAGGAPVDKEAGVTDAVVVSGIVGAVLGALLAGLVILVLRK